MVSSERKNRIHYTFLIDDANKLIPCDDAAQGFLQSIDASVIGEQILKLKINSAMIMSTVILDNISYSLKVIPTADIAERSNHRTPFLSTITHIVIVQNQFLFAELLHNIGKYTTYSKEFEKVIEDYDDALYINNANGDPLCFNNRYLEATQFSYDDFFGANAYTDDSELFTPVVTPTVMRRRVDVTCFQHCKSGRDIVTTGIPIYLSTGDFRIVLFMLSALDNSAINSYHRLAIQKSTSSQIKNGIINSPTNINIVAESPLMKKCMQDAIKVSAYHVPCLLLGSSGCGKEVFASLIHACSRRNTKPFVKINCSTLSSTLLESELFGYEAGSFTGALHKGKQGFFETANQGTLLLDEIGDMPLDSQAKLLRVLETGEFYRVGGNTPIRTDVRILAATNKNLKEQIKKGEFRSDLYYRLNVAALHIPDLKDRKEDIPLLVNHFSYNYNIIYHTYKVFSKELLQIFENYHWPGNVRELRNVIERLTILSTSTELTSVDIADFDLFDEEEEGNGIAVSGLPTLEDAVDQLENILVKRALAIGGNTRRAAQLLHVSQSTIMRRIKKFNREELDELQQSNKIEEK